MRFSSVLDQTLGDLARGGLLREPDDGAARRSVQQAAARLGCTPIDASSNDYLGLAGSAVSRETSGNAGAGASRLIHGTAKEHIDLEECLAEWVATQTSLLFASTYAANVGLVSAVGVADSIVISDAANHASLIDGARLAKADVRVIPHLSLEALEGELRQARHARAAWVLTESYFSMDGDGPDLAAMRRLCSTYDACLVVDEAHALGVFGPKGAGRCAEAGIAADVVVGALGKAVGTHGGFVGGSERLRTFLWNRARSFVFSTAPSPQLARLTLEKLREVQRADALRARLIGNSLALRARLAAMNLISTSRSFGPIISIVLGDNERVMRAAARLREAGILAQAVRPPTVAAGAARLRLTVKATFGDAEMERLAREVELACAS